MAGGVAHAMLHVWIQDREPVRPSQCRPAAVSPMSCCATAAPSVCGRRARPTARASLAFCAALSPESLYAALPRDVARTTPISSIPTSIPTGAIAERCSARSPKTAVSGSSPLASYARLRDPAAAEVAFAVADELPGTSASRRGCSSSLPARAASEGIERLVFEILPGNRRMLSVVADAGFEVVRAAAGGVVEATMLIEPTSTSTRRADERDHVAIRASLHGFLEPRERRGLRRVGQAWHDRRRAVPERASRVDSQAPSIPSTARARPSTASRGERACTVSSRRSTSP